MVISCSAYGCQNRHGKTLSVIVPAAESSGNGKAIAFHRYTIAKFWPKILSVVKQKELHARIVIHYECS